MSDAAKKKASYQDLFTLPDNLVGEIVSGQLYTSPRPSPRHVRTASKLGGLLDGPFDSGKSGPGGWIFLDEPELHLKEDILVPDLAAWRTEHLPKAPEGNAISVPPDWICEVISPGTERIDRVIKMSVYAKNHVPYIWLINPLAKTLEAYQLDAVADARTWRLYATHSDADKVNLLPFESFELDLSTLWWE